MLLKCLHSAGEGSEQDVHQCIRKVHTYCTEIQDKECYYQIYTKWSQGYSLKNISCCNSQINTLCMSRWMAVVLHGQKFVLFRQNIAFVLCGKFTLGFTDLTLLERQATLSLELTQTWLWELLSHVFITLFCLSTDQFKVLPTWLQRPKCMLYQTPELEGWNCVCEHWWCEKKDVFFSLFWKSHVFITLFFLLLDRGNIWCGQWIHQDVEQDKTTSSQHDKERSFMHLPNSNSLVGPCWGAILLAMWVGDFAPNHVRRPDRRE